MRCTRGPGAGGAPPCALGRRYPGGSESPSDRQIVAALKTQLPFGAWKIVAVYSVPCGFPRLETAPRALSFSTDDMPRAMEGVCRRSPGVASLPITISNRRAASLGLQGTSDS